MDPNNEYDYKKEMDINLTQNYQNKTSFLIEDILYREKEDNEDGYENNVVGKQQALQKTPKYDGGQQQHQMSGGKYEEKMFQQPPKVIERRGSPEKNYSYFQQNLMHGQSVQNFQGQDTGYIQVMGALGAYLGTPYKTITDPYFLTQGKTNDKR